MRACTTFFAVLLLASAALAAELPVPSAEFPGLETIQRTDLMKTVEYLASPRLQGRLAGGPGYMQAAREMARRFRGLGLTPGGEDGFFQTLSVEYNEIDVCDLELIRPDGSTRSLALGSDFDCRGLTGSGEFTAPVVFVGYGLSQPEKGYDDYAGIDARGKIVLALKDAPPFKPDTTGWGESTLPRPKGHVAAAHGALAMLLVSPPNRAHPQKPIGSMLEGEGEQDERFPSLQVDIPVAEELVLATGLKLGDLQARIDSTRAPHSCGLAATARVHVKAGYRPKQPSVNVVGVLRGSDPGLAGEYLVVGAHLDHVGSQAHDIYFPGANDNASGAAAVLAVAGAFARGGARPKRSLIFALFTSEEAGLYGARHFVAHPPAPKESLVAYINLDCVGHGDSIEVGGGKTSPRLWQLVRDLDERGARLMVEATWPGGGADAAPFAEAGIPTLYFASKPSYTYLHLPSDTPATLNPPLLEAIARLVYRAAWRMAQDGYSKN
jgi:hypothetical protein